jgi:hypothetical protein
MLVVDMNQWICMYDMYNSPAFYQLLEVLSL